MLAILMFGVIIMIHEMGHFFAAKAVGVQVHEFAIGMGPVVFRVEKGGTKYSLRLFPIGGFIAMEGEDEDSNDPNAFCNKPVWQRIIVDAAGATMNILLGFIVMVVIVCTQGMISTTIISEFDPSASSIQKLEKDDEILRINKEKVHTANDVIFALIHAEDKQIDILVRRNNEKVELKDVPFEREKMEDGTPVVKLDFRVYGDKLTVGSVLKESWYLTTGVVKEVWNAFTKLITGQFKVTQLSGPVGVTQAIGAAAATENSGNLLMMLAFITINIGVFNLLPLPALDGGRLLFLLLEAIRGKPIPAKYEGAVHATGLFLLMGLMLFVTFQDVVKIFTKS